MLKWGLVSVGFGSEKVSCPWVESVFSLRPAGLSPSVYAWGAGASVSAGPDAKRGDF